MTENIDFEEIRPFNDDEVSAVINSLCNEPYFLRILPALFPSTPIDAVVAKLRTVKSIETWQEDFIIPFLNNVIANSTDGLTASGIENLDPEKSYLFITNHRDIVLDSAFLNVKLHEKGFKTTEIGIGDNLLIYDWITDVVKLNKSFIVKRGLPVRQMMEASGTLSAFIRYSITQQHQNIWLAQREGRSKDGNDQTQGSVLKMLNLSGKSQSMVENIKELNVVPVSISYEYDPCDYLKAYQFQQKRDNPEYKKSQKEDLTHMTMGITGKKGRIHFSFGTPISESLDSITDPNKNVQVQAIAEIIDAQIYKNYHMWPGNYVAYDMLEKSDRFRSLYTDDEKKAFLHYINEHVFRLEDPDSDFIYDTILKMYANPVYNYIKAQQP
ncbi:MAG: acyltransferase [Bacteroidales bacterium]|nr:acyltransferase [Bacteroidales bacterium]